MVVIIIYKIKFMKKNIRCKNQNIINNKLINNKLINTNIKAFTLVELIVVITILAILWTIAFISFQNYSKSARDWVRISDINNIEKNLGIFVVEKWFYPIPDNWTNITYSWAIAWTQWTVWDNVIINLKNLSKKPIDPLVNNEYAYSITNTKVEYQLATILEWESLTYNLPLITKQVNATTTKKAIAKIKWNYNEKLIKVSTGNIDYILAVPSIIASDITDVELQNIINNKKLVYNNYQNLPDSYKNLWYTMTWWFDFQPSNNIVVYSWSLAILSSSGVIQQEFITNLQTVYDWTIIESEPIIKEIITSITSKQKQILAWAYIDNHIWGITWKNTVVIENIQQVQEPQFLSNCTSNWQIIYTNSSWVEIWKVTNTWAILSWSPWSLDCNWHIVLCSGINTWYTLQACNAWATIIYTNQTFEDRWTSRDSTVNAWAWWLYQWGNNADVSYTGTNTTKPPCTINSTFSQSTFITSNNDWCSIQTDNIWWGTLGIDETRKWPCSAGYHVPTNIEWQWIYNAWWWDDLVADSWIQYLINIASANIAGPPKWEYFSKTLKIPMAGNRVWHDALISWQNFEGYYWSSSPYWINAFNLSLYTDYLSIDNYLNRSNAFSVRCIRN